MPFLLLLLLTMVCLVDPWPEPLVRLGAWETTRGPIAWSLLLTSLTVFAQAGLAAGVARWTASRLLLFPDDRVETIRRHGRLRFYLLLSLLGGYNLALWVWGWGWATQVFWTAGAATRPIILPGAELLTLAPLLAGLLLTWTCLYDADRALHETAPHVGRSEFFLSRFGYVFFQLRQNLALVLVPLVLLVAEKGASRIWPGIYEDVRYWVVAMGVLAGVFVGLPWILRLVLGLRPLPKGPLRDRLEISARRLKFRCGDILEWDTRGAVANAMVVGLLPRPRYVILTDKLIAELSPDEVESVFGHEVGHARHHHMLTYLVFLLLSVAALAALWGGVVQTAQALGAGGTQGAEVVGQLLGAGGLRVVPFVALMGAYVFVVFGFLSRRCERQADLFGCRAVSCGQTYCTDHYADGPPQRGEGLCPTGIRTFISALEKVAYLNGISRDRPGWLQSWQHSTIAKRVEFLQRVLFDPTLERRFQRQVLRIKCVLLLGLAAFVAVAWPLLIWPGLERVLISWFS